VYGEIMKNQELVFMNGREPVTSTLIIAENLKVPHVTVFNLVKKYKDALSEDNKKVEFEIRPSKSGQSIKYAILSEEQTSLLIMLMKNTKGVLKFKIAMNKAFHKMKKFIVKTLAQQQNAEWLEQRKNGKVIRREETDIIKEFIEYAKAQGSKNAEHYYMHFTNATHKALFVMVDKYPDLRNCLSMMQLMNLGTAEHIATVAIKEGMEKQTEYHQIFKEAKNRLIDFSKLVPKTKVELPYEQQKLLF